MKKCDIKGCKNKAEVFSKHFSFCRKHWEQLLSDVFTTSDKSEVERK